MGPSGPHVAGLLGRLAPAVRPWPGRTLGLPPATEAETPWGGVLSVFPARGKVTANEDQVHESAGHWPWAKEWVQPDRAGAGTGTGRWAVWRRGRRDGGHGIGSGQGPGITR